jgi:hypothetical protein
MIKKIKISEWNKSESLLVQVVVMLNSIADHLNKQECNEEFVEGAPNAKREWHRYGPQPF